MRAVSRRRRSEALTDAHRPRNSGANRSGPRVSVNVAPGQISAKPVWSALPAIGDFLKGREVAASEERGSRKRLIVKTGAEITHLFELSNEEIRPDSLAHVRAHSAILKLVDLGFEEPANDVYSDPDGAIRLLWNSAERSVELVFPSFESELPYLYRSTHDEYKIEENPTPECSLNWLRWVLADSFDRSHAA